MKRDSLLVTGLGQCGNILANLMREYNNRYATFYVNSSLGDVQGLRHADLETNVFIYSGGDGSGRDRDKANKFIQNDKVRLASVLKKYAQFKYMLIFVGMGGGTGSGTIVEFIKIVKRIFPNMIVNVVGVIPSFKENNLELKNTISCLSDLSRVSELINDLKFIDNNKRANYNDINKEAITTIDESYSMLGHTKVGSVDEDNLTKVTTAKGYGIALKLDPKYDTLESCIKYAIHESVFALPTSLECLTGAINVSEKYEIDDVDKLVRVNKTFFKTYGKRNVLALGGCLFPDELIDELESNLKERELRSDNSDGRIFKFKSKYNVVPKEESIAVTDNKQEKSGYIDDDDIDNLFNPNNFKF